MNTKKLTILFLLNSLFIEGPLASIDYRETSDDSYFEEKRLDMHDPKDFSERLKYSLEKGVDELQSFESEKARRLMSLRLSISLLDDLKKYHI